MEEGVRVDGAEAGTERTWWSQWAQFTLMKGHTLYSIGQQMRLWNATARRGPQGPFFEVRRGLVWMQELADKTEIKFTAWSY